MQSLTFPVGPINLLESTGRSSYNVVLGAGKRRFSGGLSFLASYTYADSMTDAPTFRSPAKEAEVPQNSFDLAPTGGLSGCDIRHRFVSSVIYKVPVSARGAAAARARTDRARPRRRLAGVVDLPVAERLPVHDQRLRRHGERRRAAQRQSRFARTSSPACRRSCRDQRSADMWFNTAAFTTPAPFTFGTAARNSVWGPGLQQGRPGAGA